jgi:hypothetical protein
MIERLTVGYRCRVKPDSSWAKHGYAGHECILVERSSGGDFSVLMLKEGKNVPLSHKGGVVIDKCAWFDETADLELVDKNLDDNLRFMAWWSEVEEYECPDCRHLCWDDTKQDHTMFEDEHLEWCCPKCKCGFR